MEIKENYVSLETAKWLKANGFNEPCHKVWDTSCAWTEWYVHSGQHVLLSNKISCPSLGHVVEWFIKKHGLFIKVDYDYYKCEGSVVDETFKYGVDVIELGKKDEDNNVVSHISAALFDDHYEAVEHGIDMCIVIVTERNEQRKARIPNTMEEAFQILDQKLSKEDQEYLIRKGPLVCHNTIGRWIRNNFGLWDEESNGIRKHLTEIGFIHPDDMSHYIMEEYIKHLNVVPEEEMVPYEIISELFRKGFPVKNVTDWYCEFDNMSSDDPITKGHYPLVSQDRVLNWLKMKHDIFVEVSIFSDEEMETLDVKDRYAWNIYFDSTGDIRPFNGTGPDKPTAINNAIKCCVKDLI